MKNATLLSLFSSTFTTHSIKIGLVAAAAALTAACGSSGSTGGTDGNGNELDPDGRPSFSSKAPDECRRYSDELLPAEGLSLSNYGNARQAWNPLTFGTRRSENGYTASNGGSGSGPTDCLPLHEAFTGLGLGKPGTREYLRFETQIESEAVDFPYPKDAAEAAKITSPIDVKTKSTVVVTYLHHFFNDDGTVDYNRWVYSNEEQQRIPVDVTCEKPYTAEVVWEEREEGGVMCRTKAGTQKNECAHIYGRYTAERCVFTTKVTTFRLPDGRTVKASFGGTFDKPRTVERGKTGFVFGLDAVDFQ